MVPTECENSRSKKWQKTHGFRWTGVLKMNGGWDRMAQDNPFPHRAVRGIAPRRLRDALVLHLWGMLEATIHDRSDQLRPWNFDHQLQPMGKWWENDGKIGGNDQWMMGKWWNFHGKPSIGIVFIWRSTTLDQPNSVRKPAVWVLLATYRTSRLVVRTKRCLL